MCCDTTRSSAEWDGVEGRWDEGRDGQLQMEAGQCWDVFRLETSIEIWQRQLEQQGAGTYMRNVRRKGTTNEDRCVWRLRRTRIGSVGEVEECQWVGEVTKESKARGGG